MIELYRRSLKGSEASVEASLHELLHSCKLMNNQFHKRD